jgi:hypothetical protein
VTAFDAIWQNWHVAEGLRAGCTANPEERLQRIQPQYNNTLETCRALAAAAPLPRICNHLRCENMAGVSEAAAASKVCAGCRAGYCSAACHVADRKRHKHACRRMAAAGESCV